MRTPTHTQISRLEHAIMVVGRQLFNAQQPFYHGVTTEEELRSRLDELNRSYFKYHAKGYTHESEKEQSR